MNIGDAAQAAGVTAKMIRHYESLGLIAQASRSDGGYRQYGPRDVSVLRFIRQSRFMGFSIKQIEQLLGLWSDSARESREVMALTRGHIAELDRKMAEMAEMKAALQQIADTCRGDDRPDCPILGRLSAETAAPPARLPTAATPGAKPRPKPEARSAAMPGTARRANAPAHTPTPFHSGLVAWMQGLDRSAAPDAAA
jgi:Cu(I)-responsive transcriptional regulator